MVELTELSKEFKRSAATLSKKAPSPNKEGMVYLKQSLERAG
jgi:hypothetical protein